MTAADVWQRDRGVVPGNLLTMDKHCPCLLHGHTQLHPPPSGDMEKKEVYGQILENVDSQTNLSGKEIAINQVEKMLKTGTMAEVHKPACG